MKQLPVPVRDVLDGALDEAVTQRVWREVAKRRARASSAGRAAVPRLAWALAAAFVLVGLLVWNGSGSFGAREPAPLSLAGGAALSLPSPGVASLDDGSRIEVFPGSRLAVLENSGRVVTLLLESGRARFEVTPGGPRRWGIECGVLSVEVVGTRFEIERTDGGARVRVEEGVVLVRGERVRDHVQRLTAGEALEVGAPAQTQAAPPESPGPAAPEPSAVAGAASSSAPGEPRPASSASSASSSAWRELAGKGAYKEAYGVLGKDGIAQEARRATLDELMQLADVARLSGHPADAVAPLARVVAEHRGDSRASMAAFTLGRLRLDQLGQPAAAADDFATAIALGLPAGLVEDAHARLVEARARAGDRAGASLAAADYERRFPNGRRLAAVRAWVAAE